jgi:hypothetical protein
MPEIHSADIVAAADETRPAATNTAETAASDATEPTSTDATEATSTDATEPASANATAMEASEAAAVEAPTAAVEAPTAAVETTTTATTMKCRRGLRRHDGRRRCQQDCADRYTDFIHDYLPHHLNAMLLSEAAP